MGLRLAIAECAKEHPELAGVLRAELRKVSRDVKTLNVKFKLNGVKILDSYLNEVDDTTSGTVAMSGTIGIRMGMGMWHEWVFKGVFDLVQAQSGHIDLHNKRGPRLSKDPKIATLLEDILVEQIGGKLVDMLSRHALKWGNTSESQDEVMGGQVFKGSSVSVLTPPKFDANQWRYFKGPGKTLGRVWRERKENPKWSLIERVIKEFEGYKYLREKPGWEDNEQTVSIMDALDKLTKYRDHLYPGGKPKPKRKKTPRAIFLEQMDDPEVKSLISKFSRIFKGKPAEAGQFAFDVLEDANFHREGGNMNVAMADYTGATKVAPSSVAQKLGWDSRVLPFAVGLVSGAGDKRGASQMVKTFVQMNKDWYVEAA